MSLSFALAGVKYMRKEKNKAGGRRSIVKEIPEEILMEILAQLPANSLMRFKCVTRLWSTLISSRYFTNLFFKISSSITREPRVFFMYYVGKKNGYVLCSSSLSNLDPTHSLTQLNHDATFAATISDSCRFEFMNTLRGLMCFKVGREIQIINLTTRQVLSLPLVKFNVILKGDFYFWEYLGYDSVNDEYKVVSTICSRNEFISETQILVLGTGASWRKTKSHTSPPPHHCPHRGIFISGVLYYGARFLERRRCVLMSFDLNTEEFNLFEFPIEAPIYMSEFHYFVEPVNYQGQVAVIDNSRLKTEYILDLWVLEDARKSKWSHKSFVLPYPQLIKSIGSDLLRIRGTSCSGEVAFAELVLAGNRKHTLFIYDLESNRIKRKVVVDLPYPISFYLNTYYWVDVDVESIMYLEA